MCDDIKNVDSYYRQEKRISNSFMNCQYHHYHKKWVNNEKWIYHKVNFKKNTKSSKLISAQYNF